MQPDAEISSAAVEATIGATPLEVGHDATVSQSPVQQFYAGAVVFVTGATGFMGKVLVEKLLWSCPGVSEVFVLVRPKLGKSAQQRVEDLVLSPCFDRLRARHPDFAAKLRGIPGDIGDPRLGITDADRHVLATRVTVVFHVAATVRFNEPLHVAIVHNVHATRELLVLARQCTKLKAVVHVSTAFANCPHSEIAEKFYDPPLDCDKAIELAKSATADEIEAMTPSLLGEWPNTYTWSKAVAEAVCQTHGAGLPLCVVRPAIVMPCRAEPSPGWVDAWSGPFGLVAGVSSGFQRVIASKREVAIGLIPCDMAVAAILVAAWSVTQRTEASDCEIPIYNLVSSQSNTVSNDRFMKSHLAAMKETPSVRAIWPPFWLTASDARWVGVLTKLLHTLPAHAIDAALALAGKKQFAVLASEKVDRINAALVYFSTREWRFGERRLPKLLARMHATDRQLFPCDMRTLDWDAFFRASAAGIRKHLLKENLSNVAEARRRMRGLELAQTVVVCTLAAVSLYACARLAKSWMTAWMHYKRSRVCHHPTLSHCH